MKSVEAKPGAFAVDQAQSRCLDDGEVTCPGDQVGTYAGMRAARLRRPGNVSHGGRKGLSRCRRGD